MMVTELRFYEQTSDEPYPPFDVYCSVLWETASVIWIRGMKGHLTRALFKELVQFCVDNRIKTVKAHRNAARRLPLGRQVGEHLEIDVAEAAKRFRALPADRRTANRAQTHGNSSPTRR